MEKELSKVLKIILYSAFVVILSGIVFFSLTHRGRLIFEVGIGLILVAPLAEFATILIYGFKLGNRKIVLLTLWLVAVFLFSLLKFR